MDENAAMATTAHRQLTGSAVGVLSAVVLGGLLVPFRSHLSIATVALVLVIPVVAGVASGGLTAGVASVVAGFLVYDFMFIRPYYTLTVGVAQNWVALAVYVVVMLVVSRVVVRLQAARADAMRRDAEARRLLELSDLLVTDRPVGDLLQGVVDTVLSVSGCTGVALLLPSDGALEVAASAGEPIPPQALAALGPASGTTVSVSGSPRFPGLHALALSAAGRPVGLLALQRYGEVGGVGGTRADAGGAQADGSRTGAAGSGWRSPAPRGGAGRSAGGDTGLLQVFANQAALAIERSQLHERALRSEALEEADRFRQALLAVVSHDLRTPLATMKVASSALLDASTPLPQASRMELYELLDSQTDRLTRLVSGLLDMSRYQADAMHLHLRTVPVAGLVEDAVSSLGPALADRDLTVHLPDDLPDVCVDRVLIGQVLVNLLDNAHRYSPAGAPVTVSARANGGGLWVEISVADAGPGVPPAGRQIVFESYQRSDTGGRAGLGLWICKTFVEAHGGRIHVADRAGTPGPGAEFVFSLPVATSTSGQTARPAGASAGGQAGA